MPILVVLPITLARFCSEDFMRLDLTPSMPNTSRFHACGSNLHQQIRDHDEHGDPLTISHFVPILEGDVREVNRIVAVSASQVAYSVSEGNA